MHCAQSAAGSTTHDKHAIRALSAVHYHSFVPCPLLFQTPARVSCSLAFSRFQLKHIQHEHTVNYFSEIRGDATRARDNKLSIYWLYNATRISISRWVIIPENARGAAGRELAERVHYRTVSPRFRPRSRCARYFISRRLILNPLILLLPLLARESARGYL